jgi:hypothetical protein
MLHPVDFSLATIQAAPENELHRISFSNDKDNPP